MSINPNFTPAVETRDFIPEVITTIGATAIDVEEYVSPQFVAEVPAEVVTLGAVNGFVAEQTAGYKQTP